MDPIGFILSQTLFDILFILVLLGALILGFVQGAIRHLLGTAAILVAFLIAANLRDPIGGFLADNWRQFPAAYSVMIGFLATFLILWAAGAALIQGFYRRSLIHRSEALDEIAGAAIAVVETILLVGILGLILDSYFTLPTALPDRNEIDVLRSLYQAWDLSRIAEVFRGTILPGLIGLTGLLLPDAIESLYRR